MNTESYQRASRSRLPSPPTPFVANHPTRLRSDQLFQALKAALSIPDRTPDRRKDGKAGMRRGPQALLAVTFGFDPSTPAEDVSSSIPQGLQLMNSQVVSRLTNLERPRGLGRTLRATSDDEAVIEEIYLRCLSRPPTNSEVRTSRQAIFRAGNRMEGFEDILWALINSAEFIYRS